MILKIGKSDGAIKMFLLIPISTKTPKSLRTSTTSTQPNSSVVTAGSCIVAVKRFFAS